MVLVSLLLGNSHTTKYCTISRSNNIAFSFLQAPSGYFIKPFLIIVPFQTLSLVSLRGKRGLSLLVTYRDILLLALGGSISRSLERLLKVGDNIVNVLDTN
jgi:hypothetical protein